MMRDKGHYKIIKFVQQGDKAILGKFIPSNRVIKVRDVSKCKYNKNKK
jgi:hypothetical protein